MAIQLQKILEMLINGDLNASQSWNLAAKKADGSQYVRHIYIFIYFFK